jgi:hypothetical protein
MGFLLPWIIASPISRYSGEVVLSEEVPAGWWGIWDSQRATESLLGRSYVGLLGVVTKMLRSSFFFFLANLVGGGRLKIDLVLHTRS